jgi:acetyl esterase/lipase
MRVPLALGLLLAACASDVDVTTVVYDPRHDASALDVHAPVGAAATPAVLLVHGGGWWTGDRDEMTRFAERLAAAGYVAAAMDYRLVPDHHFPAQVLDTFCALSYLRASADTLGIDPARIAVLGYSAGAHLAAMTGVAADVAALQDPGCPSGLTGPAAAVIAGAGPFRLDVLQDGTTERFIGASIEEAPEAWALAAPINHVGPGEPPFLLVHAEHDLVVDREQSDWMRAALAGAGNRVQMLRLEGGGHAFNEGSGLGYEQYEVALDTPVAWAALIDFLRHTVGAP